MNKFNVTATPVYANAQWTYRYKLRAYHGSGSACVVESNETWPTKDEAALACDRVNSGDASGLTFAQYADD